MTEFDHNTESVQVLHRMIAYVRDEARRLHITDVATLLDHAEDAILAFALPTLADHGFSDLRRDPAALDH